MCPSPHTGPPFYNTQASVRPTHCCCRAQASSTVGWLLQLHRSGWDHSTAGDASPPAASSQPRIPEYSSMVELAPGTCTCLTSAATSTLSSKLTTHKPLLRRIQHHDDGRTLCAPEAGTGTGRPGGYKLDPPQHMAVTSCAWGVWTLQHACTCMPQAATAHIKHTRIHHHWQGLTCTTRYCDESIRCGPRDCKVRTGPGGSKHIRQQLHFTWNRDLQGAQDLQVAGGNPVDRNNHKKTCPRPQPTTPLLVRNRSNSKPTYSAATGWYRHAAGLC